ASVDAALGGTPMDFDLAYANDRPFLANVGAGFDADVVHVLHAHRQSLPEQKSISMASYVPIGLRALSKHKAAKLHVTIDGKPLDITFADVVVCNTSNYGGILSLTPAANPRDGQLDVYLRRRRGRVGILRHLASATFRWKDRGAVERLQGREIVIESDEPVPLQVDGDPAGFTPLRVHLGSQKIKILTPK
ncbi:MAG: diacylglycerol kinase (ATP), partial [Planctomycetota bacterium]